MDLPGQPSDGSVPNLRGVPDAPPVTAMAPYVAPPHQHQPNPAALAIPNPPLARMRTAGYAGVPQVISAEPEDDADLVTWLIRGIDFVKRYWLSILLLGVVGCGVGIASYKFRKPPAKAEFELSLVPIAGRQHGRAGPAPGVRLLPRTPRVTFVAPRSSPRSCRSWTRAKSARG